MRLALFTDALADRPLGDVLEWLASEAPSLREVELGTGGYSPAPHCDRASLAQLDDHGYRLAALNVSGNPLEREDHDAALRDTIRLAGELGVPRVVCMSGGRAELAGAGWFPGATATQLDPNITATRSNMIISPDENHLAHIDNTKNFQVPCAVRAIVPCVPP